MAGGRGRESLSPCPEELTELLESRIRKLPARSRDALLAAALLSSPTTQVVERALGSSAREALERSLRADVIELREERIRFRHPLLAGAVSSSFVPAKRRAMHRRLAEAVESEEQRAWHLALAADGPDEAVALSLEEAAAARGGSRRARGGGRASRARVPAHSDGRGRRARTPTARPCGRRVPGR